MTPDPVAVLQKFLSAASHKRLAEREIAWENPIDQNHKGYRKLMEMHHRLMREALAEARQVIAERERGGRLRRALAWLRKQIDRSKLN